MASTQEALEERLRTSAEHRIGPVDIRQLQPLAGGHAGLTYSFEWSARDAQHWQPAVLKLGPPGVKRTGAADIFRQARLLQTLGRHGVPVPALLWAEPDDAALGAPCIVMERLPGAPLFPLAQPGEATDLTHAGVSWSAAAKVVAQLQDPGLRQALSDWEQEIPLAERFAACEATLRKAPEEQWIEIGLAARDALLECMPRAAGSTLAHGDLQTSNLLVDAGRLMGIIDWDLAHLGAPGTDLGWLLLFADNRCWGPHWRSTCPYSVAELLTRVTAVNSDAATSLDWFRGYAAYRFGAIACFNVRLHRTGRRQDPIWEIFARDIPLLFSRAREFAALHRASVQ